VNGQSLAGLRLVQWTNGNLVYSSSSATDLGTLTSLPRGGFLILCSDKATFDSLYTPATCHHEASAADSNGGDTIGIIDVSDNIIDIFGIPGELGVGTARDFVGGRVERRAGVNSSRASWRAAYWNIQSGAEAPGSFDPHRWVGAPAVSTVKVLSEYVAEELSPFVSLALDAARTDLSKTQVTMARSDTAIGSILALTLLTNPYTADSPPSLIQVEAARPVDTRSVFTAFSNAYIQQLLYPALLVGAIDERQDIATWIPAEAAYRPSGGQTISVGTASGRLGHHFLHANLATVESQSFADIVATNATAKTYWRLTQNTSYPARAACVRLGPDSTWTQVAVSRPTATELQAAGITTDLNGFWCVAARGFGLFGIFIPFASETTTPEPSTTTEASVAQDVQVQVVSLASGLVADTVSQALQNPSNPVVVPKPDPPFGTTVDLITLPVPSSDSSSFLALTKPDDGAIPIAIPTALRSSIAAPYPAVLVAQVQVNNSNLEALGLPAALASRPSVTTAEGKQLKLGYKMVEVSFLDLDVGGGAQVLAVPSSSSPIYMRLSDQNFPGAVCAFLNAANEWSEAGTDVPSAAEISAAFGPDIAAAGGFWCSAYHLSLFAILEAELAPTTTTSTGAVSMAQNVQSAVLSQATASGLIDDAISRSIDQTMNNPLEAAVVPSSNPPAGMKQDVITLPFTPLDDSAFMMLTVPGDGAIPIAIPTTMLDSISDMIISHSAFLVTQVEFGLANLEALGLPAALASRPAVMTAEGKQLKLGYKMVEVSLVKLDLRGGAQVFALPNSSSPIYIRLSDQNFPGAVCAFLNAANEWSEAGTSVPSTAEISEAFGPVIAAAGGFWCSAYHLSLFAILEAAGDSTHQNGTAIKVQNKVFEWTGPLTQDAVQMSGNFPYTSAAKSTVLSKDIVAGLITLPFADPMVTSEFLLLAAMPDSTLAAAIFREFRSPLPASYPALAVASFATTFEAQAQFGVDGLSFGTIVETGQGQFKIGPRALQVSLVDMAQVTSITAVDMWSREEPMYFRLSSDDVFADTAICAWLNHLNEWVQDDTYRPDEAEVRAALGTAWSPGFWCATRHFGLFAILEVLVEPGDVAGAMQNLVLTSAAGVFSEAFGAASTQPQQSGSFGWSAGPGLAGALVTIPELAASSEDRFVNVVADIYEEIFIALPAWLSESVGGYDVLSVAEIQYGSMNATSRNSLPSGPLAEKTSVTLANGQSALLGSVLVEVTVLSNEPANPRAIALSNLTTPIYIRLSPQEFPDGAACAFLSSGNWAQDGTYRPDAAEVAAAVGLEASGTGFWCATNHLSLFGILEPIEEAPCDGLALGSECVAIEILLGAVGGPLGCCSICCIVYCCIKCRRPTAGKVKLTDHRGSSHEFGFQVVKESALSRVVRTPTTKSGRSGQEPVEPEEVEAVKIHVRWDVDVDKAQEANFDFSVAPDGEKKQDRFLAVTDTGVLLAESPKVRSALSAESNDAQSESPRSSRHRKLSEAEERVLADMADEAEESNREPQEPIEKEEDPDDILIIANPDDDQDSPKRIKSVMGNWEMFQDGAHVEYWSATHAQWLQGYVDGPGVVTPADPNFPTYNLVLKARRSSKQRREFVELSALRKPLREGQTVSAKLDGEDRWLPGVVIARQSIPLGYRVLLVDGPHDGESVTVLADRVRHRFPAGQRVAVYRGLQEGWRDGVVRGDTADEVPSVTVELDSKMEIDGEVVESLQHLVQPVERTVSGALRHSASSNRVSM